MSAPAHVHVHGPSRTGYVLKMYPRFSETFIVSEILAREAAGEEMVIFSLRPPVDPRFHQELGRVRAPVIYLDRPTKPSALWASLQDAARATPGLTQALGRCLPELLRADVDDAVQAVALAHAATVHEVTHLHAHFASLATTVARLASLLTGTPYSFTAHAKDLFLDSVDPIDLARKLRDAHHTVTVSDYNLAYLRSAHPLATGRLHRVYNGLELSRFPYAPPPERGPTLRVVAVGRLVEKKGFGLLIDAVAELHRGGTAVEARIAGAGELHATLRGQIERSGLAGVVRLLGPVPQGEVIALLRDADVFVAPCVVGADGNADGLPTSILEAMAIGVPCVATDVTGIPEVVRHGETGLLCRAGSVEDLVVALQRLVDPGFDRDTLALRARRLIETDFDSVRQASHLRALAGTPLQYEVALADESRHLTGVS